MTKTEARIGTRAVVIGGSIGGLLAARVLADFYDDVVIIDRDRFGAYGEYRKGVAQAPHAHGLLAGGQRAMEELLPGLTGELLARGAIAADLQAKCVWVSEGHALTTAATGLRGLLTSRLLVEDQIRGRVATIPNVTIHERCDALGLTVDPRGRVKGVRVVWRDREGAEALLDCDLLVDASGRGSRMPAWLHAIGYPTPRTDEVVMGLSCTTREFVRTVPDTDAENLVVTVTAENPRGGVMLAQPDGRWVVTLGGYLGETAPSDLDGFRAFAPSYIADAITGLTPIGDARTFKFRASAWRRYDCLRRLPEGLLVLGDAICSVNPMFWQGMSVTAREALVLQRCLRHGGAPTLGRRYFAATRHAIAVPWEIAASSDLRLPAVYGRRTSKIQMTSWYLRQYLRAAQRDDELGLAFLQVLNLLAEPATLLAPRSIARVVRGVRKCS